MARFKFFNVNFFAGVMSFFMNISAGADGFMYVSLSSPADMFGFDLKARCTCVSSQKRKPLKIRTKPPQQLIMLGSLLVRLQEGRYFRLSKLFEMEADISNSGEEFAQVIEHCDV